MGEILPCGLMKIWCCSCEGMVIARLTDGREIYPHRPDLADRPMWKCDACSNYVGTHWKTMNPTQPLGNIPTPELRRARIHIHDLIDPVWRSGRMKRKALYAKISESLGYKYHTADITSVGEARNVYRVARNVLKAEGLTDG